MMKKSTILTQLLIVIAIIVVANLISRNLYFRIDFTEDKRYTLSKASKNIVEDLDEVINITAYFSEDVPIEIKSIYDDFEDFLIEYEDLSRGNLVYQFVDPQGNDQLELEIRQKGIPALQYTKTENDRAEQVNFYMGVILQSGDQSEIIQAINPSSVEYDLTKAIKKLAIRDKPKIGMISGYGSPSINAFPQLVEQLSVLYDVEELNIADTFSIPTFYRGLIWVAPTDTIAPIEFSKLDQYLNQGGKLFLSYSSVAGDLQQGSLQPAPDIGIKSWVAGKGLSYNNEFVIDQNCLPVTVQQRQGFLTINSQKSVPFLPRVSNFDDHPITQGLEQIILPFVNAFTINNNADTTTRINPLAFSSTRSGTIPAPGIFDINRKWTEADFPLQEQILASSIEGLGVGNGAMVVIGNGNFIINGEGQEAQRVNPDNLNFASNAIDWLADDTGLIALRTKAVTARTLEKIDDGTKNLLKYGNVFAPILLILIYAGIRKQIRNRRKQRWTQGNFA